MKINTLGKIISGDLRGWFVIIKEDLVITGGYYVIQSSNMNFKDIVYDNWFLSLHEVEQYLKSYEIEWVSGVSINEVQ